MGTPDEVSDATFGSAATAGAEIPSARAKPAMSERKQATVQA
jgi:hypothetical protein